MPLFDTVSQRISEMASNGEEELIGETEGNKYYSVKNWMTVLMLAECFML